MNKGFTLSGFKAFVDRVIAHEADIPGVVALARLSDTAAWITYDPAQTSVGGILRHVEQYRTYVLGGAIDEPHTDG